MSDRDPLAPIKALLDDLRMDESPHPMIHGIDRRLRGALAEAREAMEGLVRGRDKARKSTRVWQDDALAQRDRAEKAEAERDDAREALGRVEALAGTTIEGALDGKPVSLPLIWASDLRAALTQPATDEEAGQ